MSETPTGGEGFFTNEDLFRLRTTAADSLKKIITEDPKSLSGHHEGVKAQTMAALGIFQIEPQFNQQIETLQLLEDRITEVTTELEGAGGSETRGGQ